MSENGPIQWYDIVPEHSYLILYRASSISFWYIVTINSFVTLLRTECFSILHSQIEWLYRPLHIQSSMLAPLAQKINLMEFKTKIKNISNWNPNIAKGIECELIVI